MKRAFTLTLLLAAITGCSDSPTAPSGDANRPQFTVNLLASSEVPPVANAESGATGLAVIHFNLTRDGAGTITAATADFQVELSGFEPASAITAAHIHTGAAGVNGGVLVSALVSPGQVTLTNGVATFTRAGLALSAANAQAIVANPAAYYFNVHTTLNPGGVVRGQLSRTN